MFLPCAAKIERYFWEVILGRQIILERLGVLVNLLCLSLKSACTKVEFFRVELLKSCPPFTPYFVQNLTYLRTKTRNAKGYRCNHLSWYVSATWLSEPNFHDMHAGTWQNILVVDGSMLECHHSWQIFWIVSLQSNHSLLSWKWCDTWSALCWETPANTLL